MSKVKSLMEEIRINKLKRKNEIENIKYFRNRNKSSNLTIPYIKELKKQNSNLMQVNKEELKTDLKLKYKLSWKDPGYVNNQFCKPNIISPKLLNEWEIERALMPEKNYKKSKNNNCFRMCHQLNEFPKPSKILNSEIFNRYLKKFEKKYNDRVLRPSKYEKQKEQILLEKIIKNDKKEIFRINNTKQNIYFGFLNKLE